MLEKMGRLDRLLKMEFMLQEVSELNFLAECILKTIGSAFLAWVEQTIQKVRR